MSTYSLQKVIARVEQERRRCESILAKERKKVSTLHTLTKPDNGESVPSPPRYDLSELRHNQRRCAALLFGARKRGSHEIPRMVSDYCFLRNTVAHEARVRFL
mgnify:CR=1 FL=1